MVAENKLLKDKINTLEAESLNYESLLTQADKHFEEQIDKLRKQVKGRQLQYLVYID